MRVCEARSSQIIYMANYTTTATTNLQINGRQASKILQQLEGEAKRLEQQLHAAQQAGDPKAVRRLNNELQSVRSTISNMRSQTVTLENTLRHLDTASPRELNKALRTLKNQLNGIQRGTKAWDEHTARIRRVQQEIDRVNASIRHQQQGTGSLTQIWNKCWGGIMAAVAAVTIWVTQARRAVDVYAAMQQEEANVSKYTGMATEQVERLNEEFKKIDTRHSREELNKYAQEAGRLGMTTEGEILGYVRAADKVNVALDDLGEGATLTLSKLAGIFGDESRLGTEKALLSVGSVVNELSQNCKASAPYLTEFTSRLGGVGAQANMTIPQIMAFGAVLDSNNQNVEASSTALSQVIVRLYQDPAKYARVAGLDAKKFAEQVKTDMNGALIEFLATLNKAGKMDVLSPMFKDMGEKGSNSVKTLATLANHIDEVRQQQEAANVAFAEAVSIDKEAAVQNNTVQARLDKTKNTMHELTVELGKKLLSAVEAMTRGTVTAYSALVTVVDFIIKYRKEIIAVTAAVGLFTAALNLHTIRLTVAKNATILWNSALGVGKGILPVLRLLILPLTQAVNYFTNGLQVNYTMQERWRKSMQAMKFTHWAGLILAVASAIYVMANRMKEARKAAEEQRQALNRLEAQARANCAEELSMLDQLYKKTQDQTLAQDERIKAVDRLQAKYPQVFKNLSKEEILAGKAADAYNRLRDSILDAARAEGRKQMIADLEKEIQDLQAEYEKEAEYWIGAKWEAMTRGEQMGIPRENDPSYLWAQRNLDIIESKYKPRIDELKKRQEGLAATNAQYIIDNAPATDPDSTVDDLGGGGYTPSPSEKELSKAVKARLAAMKAAYTAEQAENLRQHREGLLDWEKYNEQKLQTEIDYHKDRAEYLKSVGEKDSTQFQESTKKVEELLIKKDDTAYKLGADKIDREAEEKIRDLKKDIYSSGAVDELASKEHEVKLQAIADKMALLKKLGREGTEEYHKLQVELQKIKGDFDVEQAKKIYDSATSIMKKYSTPDFNDELKKLLDTFDSAEAMGLDKEKVEEVRNQAVKDLIKSLLPSGAGAVDDPSATIAQLNKDLETLMAMIGGEHGLTDAQGATARAKLIESYLPDAAKDKKDRDKVRRDMKRDLDFNDSLLAGGVIDEKKHKEMAARIKKYYQDALNPDASKGNDQIVALYTSFVDVFKKIKEGGEGVAGAVANALTAAVAVMQSAMQSFSQYAEACNELEIARLEKRYKKQSELAEGNSVELKRIEKQREKEIAKIKAEQSRKQFALQTALAIATTAQSAVQAYSAALSVGGLAGLILAPIAAAAAVAAGAIQIATIKKQQQAAEVTGYAVGGFTRKGRVNEPAGIVHAGEWVASQKLVNNPATRPLIDILEYAQRTNTLPAITRGDVSARLNAPYTGSSGRNTPETDNYPVMTAPDGGSDVFNRLESVMSRLSERLDEPFVTVNDVTGPTGMKQAFDRYSRLISNKNRQKR